MNKSILAGIMISLGCIIYLIVGGPIGAILFSVGLISVVTFKLELFTGKAGLLATNEIKSTELGIIWIGNFIGTMGTAMIASMLPKGKEIAEAALEIVRVRAEQDALTNLLLGVFCGIAMYIAVAGFAKTGNYLFCILPVVFFILCGFNHCVADMFYTATIPITSWRQWAHLLPTTIGNIIGTNLIPLIQRDSPF